MSCDRKHAITVSGGREPLMGSTQNRGDTPTFAIKVRYNGLTGASLRFTAKTCVDDPDSMAEIKKTSGTGGGIVIDTTNSTENLLLASMKWAVTDTSTIDIPPSGGMPGRIRLNYDLQVVTSGGDVITVEGAQDDAHFWLVGDVTLTNTAVPGGGS